MRSIPIAYDLIGTDETSEDYKRLIKHITTAYSNSAKVLYSTYVIRTPDTTKQVRGQLDALHRRQRRLFVVKLTGVGSWRNVICKNEWLMQHP